MHFDLTMQRYNTLTPKAKISDSRIRSTCNLQQSFRFIYISPMLHPHYKQSKCNIRDNISNTYRVRSNLQLQIRNIHSLPIKDNKLSLPHTNSHYKSEKKNIMKKLFLFLLICSTSLIIHAQESKRIPLNQLSFTKSVFNEEHNKVIFKGGKWDSFVTLPASINQELPKYKYMIINIPQSTVMVRIKFEGKNGFSKEFYQPAVKSELKREVNLSLVPFINNVKDIRIEAAQSVDETGNYHSLHIKSIYLIN